MRSTTLRQNTDSPSSNKIFLERFCLADKDSERNFFDTGGNILEISSLAPHNLPFKVYPRLGLSRLVLDSLTVFTGSVSSYASLTVKIIAAKLGHKPTCHGINSQTLKEYLSLCTAQRISSVYISEEEVSAYVAEKSLKFYQNKDFSVLDFYYSKMGNGAFVIIEHPERYMSVREQACFSEYLQNAVSSDQFLILTNSSLLLGMDNALIYDFDERPILPKKHQ